MSAIRKVISEMRSVRTSVSVMDWADRIEAALTGDVYKQFITDTSIQIREKPRHVGLLPALGAGYGADLTYWDSNVLPRLYLDLDGVMAELAALTDRFLFRKQVRPVATRSGSSC